MFLLCLNINKNRFFSSEYLNSKWNFPLGYVTILLFLSVLSNQIEWRKRIRSIYLLLTCCKRYFKKSCLNSQYTYSRYSMCVCVFFNFHLNYIVFVLVFRYLLKVTVFKINSTICRCHFSFLHFFFFSVTISTLQFVLRWNSLFCFYRFIVF